MNKQSNKALRYGFFEGYINYSRLGRSRSVSI